MPDNIENQQAKIGIVARISLITAVLLGLGSAIDAASSLFTKTNPYMCHFIRANWCPQCPDLNGTWRSALAHLSLKINQDKCHVTVPEVENDERTVSVSGEGDWNSDTYVFDFKVDRITKATGCHMNYHVRLFQVTASSYDTLEDVKTNTCDVGNVVPDHLTFIRTDSR